MTLTDEALEMAEFLLAHGADAGLRNKSGITPDEAARKRELADAADLMQALRTGRKILGSTRGDHASRGRIP
jgi:hypothetical protein